VEPLAGGAAHTSPFIFNVLNQLAIATECLRRFHLVGSDETGAKGEWGNWMGVSERPGVFACDSSDSWPNGHWYGIGRTSTPFLASEPNKFIRIVDFLWHLRCGLSANLAAENDWNPSKQSKSKLRLTSARHDVEVEMVVFNTVLR